MKKIITLSLMLFLIIIPTITHSAEYSICGLKVRNPSRDFSWKGVGLFILGGTTSIIVHELGHLAAMEFTDADYHWDTLIRSRWWGVSNDESRWIARSGFLAQNTVNLGLTKWKKKSDFTKGYTIVNVTGVLIYPLRHPDSGDFSSIDRNGGSGDIEWAIFSGIALYNLFTIEW